MRLRYVKFRPLGLASLLVAAANGALADTSEPASLAINTATSDTSRQVTGRLVLAPPVLNAPGLEAKLAVDAGAGVPAPDPKTDLAPGRDAQSWRDLRLSARAVWSAPMAKLSLEALGEMRLTNEGDLREDRRAKAAAALSPVGPVSVDLSGEVGQTQSLSVQSEGRSPPIGLREQNQAVAAAVSWRLAPQLVLRGSNRLESVDLLWKGAGQVFGQGSVDQPKVEGVLTPWAGARLTLASERLAQPFDSARFAALAAAMVPQSNAAGAGLAIRDFQPDQEWRLSAAGAQHLGAVQLSVMAARSDLVSSTELALNGAGLTAPISVTGGWRHAVQLALDLPLDLLSAPLGPRVNLRSEIKFNASELRDPVTGAARPLSGEAPFDGRVSLTFAALAPGLSLGLDTRLTGPRTYYEPARLRSVEASRSFGSFVEYQAQNVALRLQVDNLFNDPQQVTETLFQHDRSSGQVVQVDHRQEGGAGISLTLRRKV